jgi:AcrR family transcriptional regulator
MNIRNDRREAAIDRMADYVLSAGLAGATLRPLAAAAGTSDRMLLYYFADKDELLTAVLDRIAARLLSELEDAISIGPPRPFVMLLEQVWAVLGSESLKPYMNVWLDLASGAATVPQRVGRNRGWISCMGGKSPGASKRWRTAFIGGALPRRYPRHVPSYRHWSACYRRGRHNRTSACSMTASG